ncbi:MAG TPA: hypothetical protein VFF81_12285 [Noviherbaspirillum sp.]|nr:hypothetical protein [Noviherbaspirillum sp.]
MQALLITLQGKSVALITQGAEQTATIEQLRAELYAAHSRTDTALAMVELLAEARVKKQRVDSDLLARVLLKAAALRSELDAILNKTDS